MSFVVEKRKMTAFCVTSVSGHLEALFGLAFSNILPAAEILIIVGYSWVVILNVGISGTFNT